MTTIAFPNYRITQQLYSGLRSQVYRGISESTQQPVVLKLLKEEYPKIQQLVQFRNQYTIAKNLDLPEIVKPIRLENYRNSFVLVMEDDQCISLSEYIASFNDRENSPLPNAWNLKEFFPVAIQITQALERLHRHRVIHKDIKPQNIIINPETKQVKLIDFSISSLLPRESQEIINPNILEGTLAYISPEQTGRMNRGIDYRTDFYSLGVTFYELLTGKLPFYSNDPIELVHCHIARMPTPPAEINPAIGQVLNDIVMKLMAKTVEERYQTAFGLRVDLERCLEQFSATGSITRFELGQRDISDRFIIPEKLYGREVEVATLLEAFDRVSQGCTEMMLVAGFSGIGKTAVVNEVHKPIVGKRGYFIKGKFERFKREIPFSAWVQAFQNLMRQLLAENSATLEQWKAKIKSALGESGQVIIDVIPELERIIGKQPPVPKLEGSAAQNRFNLLFGKFIQLFATKEHPLVIFLDDLQWADGASLKLMQLLMGESDTHHLLLMGAYRDNEVSPAHPLMLTLNEIRQQEAILNQITLAPLDRNSLNHLIADTLSCSIQRAVPLTELVFQKTKGNPFFSNQFLKSLHDEGLIFFEFQGNSGGWQCDIAAVKALSVSDDVVEFMAAQLQKLPVNTQNVLKLAACIGNTFDLKMLSTVFEKSFADTAADLWRALQEGLVIPRSEVYKFFQDNEVSEVVEISDLSMSYKFLHDRVQQAAYSLIPDNLQQSTHLQIGRLLLNNTPIEEREAKIFDIINQLNVGVGLIGDRAERDELAQLNLIAGRKAKASTAYDAALRYLTIGRKLLSLDSWLQEYALTLTLYEEATEAAFLSGDLEQMNRLADTVLQEALTALDQVKVYGIWIQAYTGRGQIREAINTGLTFLKLIGIEFPKNPTDSDIEIATGETRSNLSRFKSIEDLIELPAMTEQINLAAMQIMSRFVFACYFADPKLFPLILCKQINLSLQHGNCSDAVNAYAFYGLFQCGMVEDIETGYQFGILALSVLERFNAKFHKVTIYAIFANVIRHWKEPLKSGIHFLLEAYASGLEAGNLQMVGSAAYQYGLHCYMSGKDLSSLEEEMQAYSKELDRLKQKLSVQRNEIFRYAVLSLLGKDASTSQLIGEATNASQIKNQFQAGNDRIGLFMYYLNKLILLYLFEEAKQAVENAAAAEEFLKTVAAGAVTPFFCFYDSLARLAVYPHVQKAEQEQLCHRLATNQEKMQKWGHHAPTNYLHKFYLVEAERHRVLGEYVEAMDDYDRAIAGAKENEFLNEEALAWELAAKFYLNWGKQTIAQTYLTNAYYAYARWGALAKVKDLEQRYPQLLAHIKASQEATLNPRDKIRTENVTTSSTKSSEALDLATVIEASQALSKEINLEQLLSSLMQVVLKNAGATFGALILHEQGKLTLEAIADSGDLTKQEPPTQSSPELQIAVNLLSAIPLQESKQIPVSAINYVANTKEILVVNDATVETDFANDPYIIQQQTKSLLCTPILNQGKLLGILYLENNLTEKAFTPDRVEVLKVLSYQAAISIENARLYNNLEQKVTDRTQELAQALEQLKATQQELILKERMAALGQLIAGIAHEINTPLGSIRASISNIVSAINGSLEQLPILLEQLSPQQKADFLDLINTVKHNPQSLSSREERQVRRNLIKELEIHGLKDADVVADALVMMGFNQNITHFLPLLLDSKRDLILQVAEHLTSLLISSQTILQAVERASKIVFALKSYIHQDSSGKMVKANVTEGIDIVLTLYQNQLKHNIETIKDYREIPDILCYPEQLNQVWTNLIHNAIQAMSDRGKLEIKVFEVSGEVAVQIIDSGCGIPSEIRERIFEPFFTTKAAGEGSGLGLDIVRKIINRHQGKIEVESQPGRTVFSVFLPVK
jgi:predicted ATPase/signal transduction histidine kinase